MEKGTRISGEAKKKMSGMRRFKDQLKQNREGYRNLVEAVPEGIIIHVNTEVEFANNRAINIIGAKRLSDLKERSIYKYILPKYKKVIKDRLKKLEQGENLEFKRVELRKIDGKIIEVEIKGIIYTFKEKPAILVFIRDISEKKLLERERIKTNIKEKVNVELREEIKERKKVERRRINIANPIISDGG